MFKQEDIDLAVLRKRAYNYRWAEVEEGVIPLTAADPDFPAAPEIRDELIKYINGKYFSYTPKMGFPEFSEAAVEFTRVRKNEILNPDYVLPIDSAARGMYIIAEAFLKEGDEAIVFDPVDFLFESSVTHAKAKAVMYPSKVKDGSMDCSDLEDYITPKTKMICLCNPHNPFGKLYKKADLQLMLDLAEKYNLVIMNDEIWSDIVYPDKKFVSIVNVDPSKNHRVMSVYGFSKGFGIAGLRAGVVYCHDKEAFEKIVDKSCVMSTAGGVSSLTQIAGITCMKKCTYWIDGFVKHLKGNRDYLVERLNKIPGLSCMVPDATFLCFVDIRGTGLNSVEFAEKVQEKGVAIVPGSTHFGPGGEGFIRICFSTSREILEEGINRIETALTK